MIPELVEIVGAPYRVLPPGIHLTQLNEIEVRFATNEQRLRLFEGLRAVVANLQIAGCSSIYINGSFTTNKATPGDFDGCWDPAGVDVTKIDPVLLDYDRERAAQKRKYGGEMFIATLGPPGVTFLEFFQIEKNTGARKGILLIQPSSHESAQ